MPIETKLGLMNVDNQDILFMNLALKQARLAFKKDEVPVGAVVVDAKGMVIGRGHNLVEHKHQQTAHAEVIAINKAAKKIGDWRLNGCTLYVTLEPCSMCMSLAALSRIDRVVYGASSPLFGYELDKQQNDQVYNRNVQFVTKGICADESRALLQQFFKKKRRKSG